MKRAALVWRDHALTAQVARWWRRLDAAGRRFLVLTASGLLVAGISLAPPGLVDTSRIARLSAGTAILWACVGYVAVTGRVGPRAVHVLAVANLASTYLLAGTVEDPTGFGSASCWTALTPICLAPSLRLRAVAGYGVLAALMSGSLQLGRSAPLDLSLTRAMGTAILVTLSVGFHLVVRSRLEAAYAEMERVAHHDELTALLNRRGMQRGFPGLFHQAVRARALLVTMIIDVDHFKRVNDTYGHEAGDLVLAQFAHKLSQLSRGGELTVRLGGEELALISLAADPTEARRVAESVRELVRDTRQPSPPPITVSIGVTTVRVSSEADPIDVLRWSLRHADLALYEAKRNGRDQVVLSRDEPLARRVPPDHASCEQLET